MRYKSVQNILRSNQDPCLPTGLINDVHRFEVISTIPAVSTAVKFNPGGGLVAGNN